METETTDGARSALMTFWNGLSPGDQTAAQIILPAFILLLLYIWLQRGVASDTGLSRLNDLRTWLGLRDIGPFWGRILAVLFIGFVLLFVLAFGVSFVALIRAFGTGFSNVSPGQSLGLGALLVALLSAPFVIWRSVVAQKTVDVTEQGQITDRINAAVEGLGTEKTVTTTLKDDEGRPLADKNGAPAVFNETKPNLEVRIGAIYALERIARENLDFHVQIMEILCAYIRENAPVAQAQISPHEVFNDLVTSDEYGAGLTAEDAFQHKRYQEVNFFGWNPTQLTAETLREWAKSLQPLRSDVQAALSVIGHREPDQKKAEQSSATSGRQFRLDLRLTNLQRARLIGDFDGAILDGSRLCGAWFEGEFGGLLVRDASLRSVEARRSRFIESDFTGASLDASAFLGCDLSKSRFWLSYCDYANFNGCKLHAGDFYGATIKDAFCYSDADFSFSRVGASHVHELGGVLEGPSRSMFVVPRGVGPPIGRSKAFADGRLIALSSLSEAETKNEWRDKLKLHDVEIGDFSRSYGPDSYT